MQTRSKVKYYKYIVVFCFALLFLNAFPSKTFASDKPTFYSNLTTSQIDDIMSLKIADIPSAFSWMKQRSTYIVVQENKTTKKITYWWNTPNMQQLLFNQALSDIVPSGFIGSGYSPYTNWAKSPFKMVTIPKASKAKTGLQKYGFAIPSPTYIGEAPRISMSIAGVLIEDNPIVFIKNKIGAVFGGSLISAPGKKELKTLEYLVPQDYEVSSNTFEKWISLYWEETMKEMQPGQILLSSADNEGKDSSGNIWVKETVLTNNGLSSMSNAKDINSKLKLYCGANYQDVVVNIIAFAEQEEIVKDSSKTPTRIMPYSISAMNDIDQKMVGIADPRETIQDKIPGSDINIGINRAVFGQFLGSIVGIGGAISEATVYLNSMSTFSVMENIGLDPVALWKMPLISSLVYIGLIILVVVLLISAFKIIKGEKSLSQTIVTVIIALLTLSFVFFINQNPKRFYTMSKDFGSNLFNMGAQSLQWTGPWVPLISGGTKSENVAAAYWLPYYSLWSNYNTNHSLMDDSIKTSKIKSEPEQQGMIYPTVAGKNVMLWSANIADSLTSGSRVQNSIYRTVDHYMAPRVTFDVSNKADMVKCVNNENYTGNIQDSVDIGILLFIIIIFIGALFKVALFIELMVEFFMLPINLVMSTISKSQLKRTLQEFGMSFVRIGLWDLVLSFCIFMTMVASGIINLLLAIAVGFMMYKGLIKLSNSQSLLTPKFLKSGVKFLNNHF